MLSGMRVSYKCMGIPLPQLLFSFILFTRVLPLLGMFWITSFHIFLAVRLCPVRVAFISNFAGELSFYTLHTSANFLFVECQFLWGIHSAFSISVFLEVSENYGNILPVLRDGWILCNNFWVCFIFQSEATFSVKFYFKNCIVMK